MREKPIVSDLCVNWRAIMPRCDRASYGASKDVRGLRPEKQSRIVEGVLAMPVFGNILASKFRHPKDRPVDTEEKKLVRRDRNGSGAG